MPTEIKKHHTAKNKIMVLRNLKK